MGLFAEPEQHNFSEDYPIGTPVRIHWATYDGMVPTQFGQRAQATIGVTPPDGKEEDAVTYRVWGTLAEQIQSAEDSDFDNPVTTEVSGKRNVWRPARGTQESLDT